MLELLIIALHSLSTQGLTVFSNSDLSNRLLLTKSKSPRQCANKVDYGMLQLSNAMQVDIDSLDAFPSYIETVKHEAQE